MSAGNGGAANVAAATAAAASSASSSAIADTNAITTADTTASSAVDGAVGMDVCRAGGSPRSQGAAATGPAQLQAQASGQQASRRASHASLLLPRPLLDIMTSLMHLLHTKLELQVQLRSLTVNSQTAAAIAVAAPTAATAQAAADADAQVQGVQRLLQQTCDAIEPLEGAKAALEAAHRAPQRSQLAVSGAAVAAGHTSAASSTSSAAHAASAAGSSVSGAAANAAVMAALLQGNGVSGKWPREHGPLFHSWPQIACTSSILHPARNLLLPRLPPGKDRVRAVLVAHYKQDHVNLRYVVPERLHQAFMLSSFPLHCQLQNKIWRDRLDVQFDSESDAAAAADLLQERNVVAGEFSVAECMGLVLNLLVEESIIAMEITGMTAFSALVVLFSFYTNHRPVSDLPFDQWLTEQYAKVKDPSGRSSRSNGGSADPPGLFLKEVLLQLWQKLQSCDVLLLPSVLLMPDFGFASDGWYERIRTMAVACKFAVHPRIEVEERMENKQRYMRHLNQQTDYEALVPKLQRHVARLAQPGARVASPPPPPPIQQNELFAGMGLIAPTVFVDVQGHSPRSIHRRLIAATSAVAAGAAAGGWSQSLLDGPLQFRIKGANSTRISHCQVLQLQGGSQDLAKECKPVLCSPGQKFLLVQPELIALQHREVRLFFANGIFITAVLTDVRDDSVLELRPLNFNPNAASSADFLPPQVFNMCHILPQLVDFAAHVLRACENYAELVSSSGLLRVDLGVECVEAVSESTLTNGDSELVSLLHQPEPSRRQWQRSGLGWIFRPFTNEVTSSLDINVYSVRQQHCVFARLRSDHCRLRVHVLTVASTTVLPFVAHCHDQQNLVIGSMDLAQVQAHTVLQQIVKFARDIGDPRGQQFDKAQSLLPGLDRRLRPTDLSAKKRVQLSEQGRATTADVVKKESKHVGNSWDALKKLGVL